MKTCFFIGHRDAPSNIYPALREAVERHITEHGVRQFYVGHYGAFDRMAASKQFAESAEICPDQRTKRSDNSHCITLQSEQIFSLCYKTHDR